MSDLPPEARRQLGEKLLYEIDNWYYPQHPLNKKYMRNVFGKRPDSPVGKPFLTLYGLDSFIKRKITGMILAAMTGKEINAILSDPNELNAIVREAIQAVDPANKPPKRSSAPSAPVAAGAPAPAPTSPIRVWGGPDAVDATPAPSGGKLLTLPTFEERVQKRGEELKGLFTGGKTRRNKRRFKKSRKPTRQKRA